MLFAFLLLPINSRKYNYAYDDLELLKDRKDRIIDFSNIPEEHFFKQDYYQKLLTKTYQISHTLIKRFLQVRDNKDQMDSYIENILKLIELHGTEGCAILEGKFTKAWNLRIAENKIPPGFFHISGFKDLHKTLDAMKSKKEIALNDYFIIINILGTIGQIFSDGEEIDQKLKGELNKIWGSQIVIIGRYMERVKKVRTKLIFKDSKETEDMKAQYKNLITKLYDKLISDEDVEKVAEFLIKFEDSQEKTKYQLVHGYRGRYFKDATPHDGSDWDKYTHRRSDVNDQYEHFYFGMPNQKEGNSKAFELFKDIEKKDIDLIAKLNTFDDEYNDIISQTNWKYFIPSATPTENMIPLINIICDEIKFKNILGKLKIDVSQLKCKTDREVQRIKKLFSEKTILSVYHEYHLRTICSISGTSSDVYFGYLFILIINNNEEKNLEKVENLIIPSIQSDKLIKFTDLGKNMFVLCAQFMQMFHYHSPGEVFTGFAISRFPEFGNNHNEKFEESIHYFSEKYYKFIESNIRNRDIEEHIKEELIKGDKYYRDSNSLNTYLVKNKRKSRKR